MINIEKIKEDYFYYFCRISSYIQDNCIADPLNDKVVQIMRKNEPEWSKEFQNKCYKEMEAKNSLDNYIKLLNEIIISSNNLEQILKLEKFIIKAIINNIYEEDDLLYYFYQILLLDLTFKYTNNTKIKNLFDYLKTKKLNTELLKLIDTTKIILSNDNNDDYSYFRKTVLKIIKKCHIKKK